jgi:hypothetical protein
MKSYPSGNHGASTEYGTETPTNIPKKIAIFFSVLVFASKENYLSYVHNILKHSNMPPGTYLISAFIA